MKIWFVLSAPEQLLGGGEIFAVRLARWLKIRGHEVEVIVRPDSMVSEFARKAFLMVRELPLRNDLDLMSRRRLKKWFAEAHPDVVAGAWGRDIKLSARAAKAAGARLYWLQGAALANKSRGHRRLDARFLAGHIVPSEFTKRQLIDRAELAPSRITVVYPGIDPKPFEPDNHGADQVDQFRRAYKIPSDSHVALCMSRLVEIKGHAHLLDAWAEVCRSRENALLVIAGDGPLASKLKTHVQELGIADRVRFTGHIPDTRPALWNADVLVVPSLDEPLGIVTLEAMAAGAAVVASRTGGIPEVVEHETSGLLVPPGDTHALRDAILRLIDDQDFRMRLVQGGHERVEYFSADRSFPTFESLVANGRSESVCA